MSVNKKYKIPVILYESEEQAIPYVEVSQEDEMPPVLMIQEYKLTGETEPGDDGEEQEIVDISMHMFADMGMLSKKLSPKLYDKVRTSIGLQPVKKARKEGKKILDKVYNNVNSCSITASDKQKMKDEAMARLNEKLTEKFYTRAETEEVQQSQPAMAVESETNK